MIFLQLSYLCLFKVWLLYGKLFYYYRIGKKLDFFYIFFRVLQLKFMIKNVNSIRYKSYIYVE